MLFVYYEIAQPVKCRDLPFVIIFIDVSGHRCRSLSSDLQGSSVVCCMDSIEEREEELEEEEESKGEEGESL